MLIHKQVIYSLRHPASNKHWLQARDITLIFKLQSSQAWLVYTEGSLHPLSPLSASKNASSASDLIPAAEHCSSLHLTITGQGHSVCGCVTAVLGRSFTWWTQLGLALSGSIRLCQDGGWRHHRSSIIWEYYFHYTQQNDNIIIKQNMF